MFKAERRRGGRESMITRLFGDSRPSQLPQNSVFDAGHLDERQVGQSAIVVDSRAIEDMGEVPGGAYVHFETIGVPDSYKESFAILRVVNKAIILVARDSIGSHARMELQGRLEKTDLVLGEIRIASREVIKSVHGRAAEQQIERAESTKVEDSAFDLVDRAVKANASDIHIETRTDFAQVFFRIHGERFEQPNISFDTAERIISVLYNVHADPNNKETSWRRDTVQGTVIEHEVKDTGSKIQLRFSSAPIHPAGNVHCVIRILRMDGAAAKPIEEVGYTEAQCEKIEEMLTGSNGVVLLVGPTNSGKSTSLQTFARRIYEKRGRNVKLITVEDPVEYTIPNACQMGVPKGRRELEDANSGSIFKTFLLGALRQDPDVVVVGEIRDEDSASAVKDFVLTGRKVLTTLHAYEAYAAFTRLNEIKVPMNTLAMQGFVSGVIYQRLVPVVCDCCALKLPEAMKSGACSKKLFDRLSRLLDMDAADIRFRNPKGCEKCEGKGITGRTACAEVLVPDDKFLSYLRAGDEIKARAYIQSMSELDIEGFGTSALAHAIQKMSRGLVDPRDVETQVGRLVTPKQAKD